MFYLDRVSNFMTKIMMEFEWRHVSMIVDETDFANKLVRSSLEKELKRTSSNGSSYQMYVDVQTFTYRNFEGDIIEDKKIDFEKVLKASSRTARGMKRI